MRSIDPRIFLATACCAALALAWRYAPELQQREVDVKSSPVAGSVHVLSTGRGGNIGVFVGSDGVLMVDDEFTDAAPKVQAAIDALAQGSNGKNPRFVVNTHFHPDHTNANPVFARTGTILAHDNVRKRLLEPLGGAPAMRPEGLPVITYGETISVHFGGEQVRVVHYANGHTDGDSVVLFTGSNVAHLGDLFFNGMFPFVDLPAGGSVRGLEHAVGELIESLPKGVAIIPGHGPVATLEDLKRYRAMLVECLGIAGKAVTEGKRAKDIVDAKLLDKYASWSWSFVPTDKWAATLVAELTAASK